MITSLVEPKNGPTTIIVAAHFRDFEPLAHGVPVVASAFLPDDKELSVVLLPVADTDDVFDTLQALKAGMKS